MRSLIFATILCGLSINAFAQTLVPGSKSPDGKIALYFQHDPSLPLEKQYKFYFRETSSLKTLSNDLTLVETPPELFVEIGINVEKGDYAHCITWSPDSQWVSIEGRSLRGGWPGEVMVFHLKKNRFRTVELPTSASLVDYYHQRWHSLNAKSFGVAAIIRKISSQEFDQPQVCWLKNGIFAMNAHQYLKHYYQDDTQSEKVAIYFLIDFKTESPTIIDFSQ